MRMCKELLQKNIAAVILTALMLIPGIQVLAQTSPQGIQYQSVFRDKDGNLMENKNVSVRFKITDAGGATTYWQEDHSATTNKYGLVNLVIGKGTKSGGSATTFSDINWSASNAKIEMLADLSGGTTYISMGNNNLWSVPYALHAPAPAMQLGDLTNVSTTAPVSGQVLKWNGTSWAPDVDNSGAKNLEELNNVSTNAPNNGQVLKWNGTSWAPATDNIGSTGAFNLDDLTDVAATNPNNGQVLKWNGTQWAAQTDDKGASKIDDLSDVTTTGTVTTGYVLKWNGTTWVPQKDNGATKTTELSDIDPSTPTSGQVLKWNGSQWAPAKDDTGKAVSGGGSSQWTTSGNNIYYNTGNVGINNSSPATRLHLKETFSSSITDALKVEGTGGSSSSATYSGIFSEVSNTGVESHGIRGRSIGKASSGSNIGASGYATGAQINTGIFGNGTGTNTSTSGLNTGVLGIGEGSTNYNLGVEGDAHGSKTYQSYGIYGSADGTGTSASDSRNVGVYGNAAGNANFNYAMLGETQGTGAQNFGIAAVSTGTGSSSINVGVLGAASGGATNYAGYFNGNVLIGGSIAKQSGSFKIDHPMDPANRYLMHSFVESPDMMNVYNGNVTTGADSTVEVTLPVYFEVLNKDFRYQLTVIGDFAQAIVLKEVADNKFVIKTNKANVKVSWQVTGIRHDPYAVQNPIIPEIEKPGPEKGTYLSPELYGQPKEKKLLYLAPLKEPLKK